MENFHYCCVSECVTWCGIVNVTVLVKIVQNVRAGSLIYTNFFQNGEILVQLDELDEFHKITHA